MELQKSMFNHGQADKSNSENGQQAFEKDRQLIRTQNRTEGARLLAANMLEMGWDPSMINQATGLAIDEIVNLEGQHEAR